jgi:hypothetical protein
MSHFGRWMALAVIGMAVGCGEPRSESVRRIDGVNRYPVVLGRPSSNLLFDRAPSEPRIGYAPVFQAEDFAYRRPWPATAAPYAPAGEAVFYREWFYDRQGTGFNGQDYLNRRFEAYRVGSAYR